MCAMRDARVSSVITRECKNACGYTGAARRISGNEHTTHWEGKLLKVIFNLWNLDSVDGVGGKGYHHKFPKLVSLEFFYYRFSSDDHSIMSIVSRWREKNNVLLKHLSQAKTSPNKKTYFFGMFNVRADWDVAVSSWYYFHKARGKISHGKTQRLQGFEFTTSVLRAIICQTTGPIYYNYKYGPLNIVRRYRTLRVRAGLVLV